MTNINCTSPCKYQKDGKCILENINPQNFTTSKDCAYFIENNVLQNKSAITKEK